ncbi:3-deoxy-manno-octulosonate cytidylyltransferase [Pseudomonas benzenivorans]|uniref:3-deoxy-manno-octulosonate cytidylyltransferase n=1 Tax=Pseudomonas benzenivorans TaxID=556533 RepID=A0ABZ0Q1X8_9PSED|nr:3-deoxy-manno-octulosonate cytidylyltransferase [Pseudomonas benzenivorans]WPC06772.1 3-deoxy-manno-octulosonate cytidylyltransferase [Pseudomonas benzenivorans]
MRTVIIIPARFKSSRFPGKPLVPLLGKPMILWVAELCAKALPKQDVYIATEDQRIVDVVEEAGFNAIMTSDKALTGTDRLAEAAAKIDADIYLNVQGDEPLLDPSDILKVLEFKKRYPQDVINGYCPIGSTEDPHSVNIPKVIFTDDHRMVYMSRLALPGFKSKDNQPRVYYKQVCIYAFSREDLLRYGQFGRKSTLEQSEDIEILRFLEWGTSIRMIETQPGSLAVDVPEDVVVVERELRRVKQ